MALTSYSDLTSTISNYLARSDLDSIIPTFVALAEQRLRRELRIRQMLVIAQATTTGGDSTVGLPSDYLEMRDIHVAATPNGQLNYDTPNTFYKRNTSSESGLPKRYTVLASELQLAPIPDTGYVLQMLYYAQPAFLSSSNPSNVFLANCPDALLYASLGEAEPYLMNDARIQTWGVLYERAIAAITVADASGEYSGQPMSMSFN